MDQIVVGQFRWSRLLAGAFFSIFGSLCGFSGAQTTKAAAQQFSSREYRIRFQFPADWTVGQPPPPDQVFAAKVPLVKNRFGAVTLRIDRATGDSPDAAILVDLSDSVADFVFKSGGKHVKIKADTLGPLAARRVSFLKDTPEGTMESAYIVAVKDRVEYVFDFTAPAQDFVSLQPAMSDLLNSFELLD